LTRAETGASFLNDADKSLGRGLERRLEDWNRELGALMDGQDAPDLPERLVRALGSLVPFELAAVFVYRGRARPLNLYDNFELADAKKGIAAYVENTYVLNPFYQASQKGLADGVYRIRDLAPDAFFESEYYKTYRVLPDHSEEIGYITEDWPESLEEIDIAITLEPDVVCELSVYRSLRNRGFADEELARLSQVVPVLGALLRRYWAWYGAVKLEASPPDHRRAGTRSDAIDPARPLLGIDRLQPGHLARHGEDPPQERLRQAGHLLPVGVAVAVPASLPVGLSGSRSKRVAR
jgi:hypothetical protein